MMDLRTLDHEPLDSRFKGLPSRAVGVPLNGLGALGLNLLNDDLPLPAAVLRQSAIDHNSRWMRAFTQEAGVALCPHGKTTMAPQLFARQLVDGAWGLTAATAAHVRVYRRFGVPRILLANQLVGQANIDIVFDELRADPDFDFYVLVDSQASLDRLREAVRRKSPGRPLQVLMEVGAMGGRAGVRSMEEGVALGRAIAAAVPEVALRGIEAFEDVFGRTDAARVELSVHAMLDTVAQLARTGCDENWFAPGDVILSAGGSSFFDIAAQALTAVQAARRVKAVLRSGCYLTHDSLHYERMQERMKGRAGSQWNSVKGPGLRAALEVWGYVQSVPEPTRAICTLGKRDVSYDIDLPHPLWWFRKGEHSAPQPAPHGLRVTALNDQHAYVDADAALGLKVGDMLGFGISHPCSTFDKWPLLFAVDDDYRVVGGVRTFF